MASKQEHKKRAFAAITDMRARKATYEVRQVIQLLEDLYEAAKEDLVGCNPQDFIGKQAECRVFKRLALDLNNDRISPQE